MTRRSCDGAGLLAAFAAAVANLEAHADEVNGLNVFPVPDGDTGSNMVATVRSALAEAPAGEEDADRIAAAIGFGALMGARGNSGVITSQILRGLADGLAGRKHFNGLDLAHALTVGSQTAYAAVGKPVEGTILTVIREAAAAAVAAAERENDIDVVLAATVEAAEVAVARTPSLLPVLREAGVVDSGGQGLLRLLQGALAHARGTGPAIGAAAGAPRPGPSAVTPHADEGFGFETMFLVRPHLGTRLDLDAIRRHLESIGESVLVAGDAMAAKVHVHNLRPDEVLAYGLSIGQLSRISVENLDGQVEDVRERKAAEFAAGGAPAPGQEVPRGGRAPVATAPVATAPAAAPPQAPAPPNGAGARNGAASGTPVGVPVTGGRPGRLAVVAVAAGDGLAAVFRSFGIAGIVRGGQSANPSTGELLAAVEELDADEVLLLPNNPNVVLAARQVAEMSRKRVHIVPTRNAAEGVAALLALDPATDGAANVQPMLAASRGTQTLQVTDAVRDAKVSGRKVKRGQTIVLDPDDGLLAVGNDPVKTILEALGALEPSFELVTLYYGEGADLAHAEEVAQAIARWRRSVEVELIHGGQPHYRFLIAAE